MDLSSYKYINKINEKTKLKHTKLNIDTAALEKSIFIGKDKGCKRRNPLIDLSSTQPPTPLMFYIKK